MKCHFCQSHSKVSRFRFVVILPGLSFAKLAVLPSSMAFYLIGCMVCAYLLVCIRTYAQTFMNTGSSHVPREKKMLPSQYYCSGLVYAANNPVRFLFISSLCCWKSCRTSHTHLAPFLPYPQNTSKPTSCSSLVHQHCFCSRKDFTKSTYPSSRLEATIWLGDRKITLEQVMPDPAVYLPASKIPLTQPYLRLRAHNLRTRCEHELMDENTLLH